MIFWWFWSMFSSFRIRIPVAEKSRILWIQIRNTALVYLVYYTTSIYFYFHFPFYILISTSQVFCLTADTNFKPQQSFDITDAQTQVFKNSICCNVYFLNCSPWLILRNCTNVKYCANFTWLCYFYVIMLFLWDCANFT